MKDVKWILKKYSFLIVLLVLIAIAGSIIFGKKESKQRTEVVWEPPVIFESQETETENKITENTTKDFVKDSEEMPVWENSEPVSLLTAQEEQNLQDEAISAARQCIKHYQDRKSVV